MKKTIISIWLFFSIAQLGMSLSCSCSKTKNRFIAGVANNNFTFLGEIIRRDSIKSIGGGNRITIFKVLKKYHGYGAFETDTIRLFNGNGMDYCIGGIRNDSIGLRYIVTGYFLEYDNYDIKTNRIYSIGKFLTLPICSVPLLKVEKNLVTGYITRSGKYFFRNKNRRQKIYYWIDEKFGYKLASWYERKFLKTTFYKPPQKMTLNRFERIIKNKIHQL